MHISLKMRQCVLSIFKSKKKNLFVRKASELALGHGGTHSLQPCPLHRPPQPRVPWPGRHSAGGRSGKIASPPVHTGSRGPCLGRASLSASAPDGKAFPVRTPPARPAPSNLAAQRTLHAHPTPCGISTWPAGRRGPASAANKPSSPAKLSGTQAEHQCCSPLYSKRSLFGLSVAPRNPETVHITLLRALQVPTFQQVKKWSLFYFKYRCSIGNINH